MLNFHRNHKALNMDGEKVGAGRGKRYGGVSGGKGGGGGGEVINLSLHCHHQNYSCTGQR